MQCMILFPGRDGRLPSAEEMRRAGFVLSKALGLGQVRLGTPEGVAPALAAEEPAAYPGSPGGVPVGSPGPEPPAGLETDAG